MRPRGCWSAHACTCRTYCAAKGRLFACRSHSSCDFCTLTVTSIDWMAGLLSRENDIVVGTVVELNKCQRPRREHKQCPVASASQVTERQVRAPSFACVSEFKTVRVRLCELARPLLVASANKHLRAQVQVVSCAVLGVRPTFISEHLSARRRISST